MADFKNLNLLVVEDDLQDEQLLCEALIEIEENRQWCNWHSANIVQVDQLSDALDCLRQQHFDTVLLNLSLPDGPALLDTFLETNACAHGAPIIVLADEEDENLANRLIREGAEDVLLKSELECSMLARSVRYAIERHRRSLADPALASDRTGVLSKEGLTFIAPRFLRLAFSRNIATHIAVLEVGGLPAATSDDREARELFILRAADALQDLIAAPSLIARVGKCRFVAVLAGLSSDQAEDLIAQANAEIEEALHGVVNAAVSFSIRQLQDDNIAIAFDNESDTERLRRAKTVMLAD